MSPCFFFWFFKINNNVYESYYSRTTRFLGKLTGFLSHRQTRQRRKLQSTWIFFFLFGLRIVYTTHFARIPILYPRQNCTSNFLVDEIYENNEYHIRKIYIPVFNVLFFRYARIIHTKSTKNIDTVAHHGWAVVIEGFKVHRI